MLGPRVKTGSDGGTEGSIVGRLLFQHSRDTEVASCFMKRSLTALLSRADFLPRLEPFGISTAPYATAAKSTKGQKAQKSGEERGDARQSKWLNILQPRPKEPASLSDEDILQGASRARDYSRRRMQAHRKHQQDLVNKIALKRAALEALPPALRAEASQEVWAQFPMNRQRPFLTPPTQGGQIEAPLCLTLRIRCKDRSDTCEPGLAGFPGD